MGTAGGGLGVARAHLAVEGRTGLGEGADGQGVPGGDDFLVAERPGALRPRRVEPLAPPSRDLLKAPGVHTRHPRNLGGSAAIENDSWNAFDAPVFAAAGAFALPAGSRDAAVVSALAPGGYTTPVGDGGGTGIVLLEVYDAETGTTGSRLVNASTRAFVGQDAGILIPGFVIQGDGVLRLLLRATGPGLVPFGVSDTLPDPQLTLYNNGLAIAANDNWGASPDASEITQVSRRLGAFDLPPQSLDAALLVSLRAGTYTAHASGVGGTTGTALVEIYLVP